MNSQFRVPLPGTDLDYFDAEAAVNALTPNAYARLPYTAKVLADEPSTALRTRSVRRCLGSAH